MSEVRPPVSKRKEITLQDALGFLTQDVERIKIRGNVELQEHLYAYETHAGEEGLSASNIHDLVAVVCNSKLAQNVKNKIVRSLIPRSSVWSKSVVRVISAFCTSKLSTTFQALLCRWIIVVLECIDDQEVLHSMYDVLFYFLDSLEMCPHICRLLFLITRKDDVKRFRIQKLLQLQEKFGVKQHLLGLLSVYKSYCPHLVTFTIPGRLKVFFKVKDVEWFEKVHTVQINNKEQSERGEKTLSMIPFKKHKKNGIIPCATSSVVKSIQEEASLPDKRLHNSPPVSYAEIKTFEQCLKYIHRIQFPSQIAAVLQERNLQFVFVCQQDPNLSRRLSYWLQHTLFIEFLSKAPCNKNRCEELLMSLIQFCDFLQESVPVCEQFLSEYLSTWNGVDFSSYIFKLITRFRLHNFGVIYEFILEPLRQLFFCSSVYFKCQVVACLNELLNNWVIVEWPRYKYTALNYYPDSDNHLNNYSVFEVEHEDFSALTSILEFIHFCDDMFTAGLQAENDHILLSHFVVCYFETVSTAYTDYQVPVVELVSSGIIYKSLFSTNAVLLNRACLLLVRYRDSLNALRVAPQELFTQEEMSARAQLVQQIPYFNGYVLDFCDCLWRYKAFNYKSSNPRTIFKLLEADEPVEKSKVKYRSQALSMHSHPALLGQVLEFQKETQPAGTRIHPYQIKHDKDVYMQFLTEKSLTGITQFIKTFIKSEQRTERSSIS